MDSIATVFSNIYVIGALQGLFVSILLFTHKNGRKRVNALVAMLILVFSLQLLSYGIAYGGVLRRFPHLWGVTQSFPFLFGPLFFLYVRSFFSKEEKSLGLRDLVHMAPFVLDLVRNLDFYRLSAETKSILLEASVYSQGPVVMSTKSIIVSTLLFLQLLLYLWAAHRIWKSKKVEFERENRKEAGQLLGWIRNLLVGFAVYTTFFFVYKGILLLQFSYYSAVCYFVKCGMAFGMYWVGYVSFRNPMIFNFKNRTKKYGNSSLARSYILELVQKIDTLMAGNKPYLQSGFSLQQLADLANTSTHHVSQVINQEYGRNFPDFINAFRVEEAKRLLLLHPDMKILAIAFESGFSSKVAFNLAFKKSTGISPSEYRKTH